MLGWWDVGMLGWDETWRAIRRALRRVPQLADFTITPSLHHTITT
jgi:hypothetical protein